MKDLTIIPKTVMAMEVIRMTIQDMEILLEEEKIVPPLGVFQTAFRRSLKEKAVWFKYEAIEIAHLFDNCRCPSDEAFTNLRNKHLKLRQQLQAVLEKAA